MDIEQFVAAVEAEAARGPVSGVEEIMAAKARRDDITKQFNDCLERLNTAHYRVQTMPALPNIESIVDAQAMLAMENALILEVDTTSLYPQDGEIIRLSALDLEGGILFDHFVRAEHLISDVTTSLTTITNETSLSAPKLPEMWGHFSELLRGSVILSWSLEFDRGFLRAAAKKHGLRLVPVVGFDLQQLAYSYTGHYMPKLAETAKKFGHDIPDRPNQSGLDRARAALAVLKAMAEGRQEQKPAPAQGEVSGEEFPF